MKGAAGAATERRAVLFGGSGFVGRHLAASLAGHGWTVRVASRRPGRPALGADTRFETIAADLRDEDLIVHSGHGRSAMYDAVVGLCRDAGFEPAIRHEVAETSTLVTFVAAALGVAIVPEPVSELMVA